MMGEHMIFQKTIEVFMDYRRTLPFYMMGNMQNGTGYPAYQPGYGEKDYFERYRYPYYADMMMQMNEEQAMQDFDYLQQMYPEDVRKYQKKIADILDKIDYRDSLIYDDYPDKLALRQLANQVIAGIKQDDTEQDTNKWNYIEDLLYVLLCYEIFRRRHRRR